SALSKWRARSAPTCDLAIRCRSRWPGNGDSIFPHRVESHRSTSKSRRYFRSRGCSSFDRAVLCITARYKQCRSHVRCFRNCFRRSTSPSTKIIRRVANMTARSERRRLKGLRPQPVLGKLPEANLMQGMEFLKEVTMDKNIIKETMLSLEGVALQSAR